MAEFPALPLWTDAFVGDTTHLSCEEVGAYILLLFAAWRRPGCDLPDDDKFLAHITRCDVRTWRKRYRPVLAPLHAIQDGLWTQKRLTKERKHVADLSKRMRENAERRWNKNNGLAHANADAVGYANAYAPIPIVSKKERIMPDKSGLRVSETKGYSEDFEAFWKAYPTDNNMPKKLAFRAWQKLTPEKRVAAARAIPGFRSYCDQNKSWYRTVYADRFLSQEKFEGYATAGPGVTPEQIEASRDWADRYFKRGKYAEALR